MNAVPGCCGRRKEGAQFFFLHGGGLLRAAVAEFPEVPIVCEGHVHTPADARAALDAGAWAVVVGTAITHPTTITSWFVAAAGE